MYEVDRIGEEYMKQLLVPIALCAFSISLHAQVVDTTVCDILKDPASFNGKMVRVKGLVTAGFDQFAITDKGCGDQVNAIWLDYPEGTHGKAGPVARLQLQPARNFTGTLQPPQQTPVKLDKNAEFKTFDSLLSTVHKVNGMCMGCNRYQVTATLVGRLDGVAHAGMQRDKTGKITSLAGFGNLNGYPARLVLESVSKVTPQEIDYSRSDPIAKNDKQDATMDLDPEVASMLGGFKARGIPMALDAIVPLGGLHKAAQAFPAGGPAQLAIERAAAAYRGKGEYNGVLTGYGATNEVAQKDEAQGSKDSPDGVTYNCNFNISRLDEATMPRALVHMGEHVADLRKPTADAPLDTLYDMEYQGWAITVLEAVGSRQRTLTLPGGYMLWNDLWPVADKQKLLERSIQDYLLKVEFLSR
jgi:hypothetical protein